MTSPAPSRCCAGARSWRLAGSAASPASGPPSTFLLAGPKYGFSQLDIGLFALVGAAGAISSLAAGRALGRRQALRWPASGAALALLAAAYLPIGLGGQGHLRGTAGLALLVIGALLMDACVQASHVINQSVIYDLLPEARSRLTTVYITTMFAGGALGSAAGAQAYGHWGWAWRHRGRGRVPGPRPAVLAGLPPLRGLGQRPGEVGRGGRREQVDVFCELPAV